MPVPREGETQEDFVSRCIPVVLDDGTASDNDQAVAVCISLWEQDSKTGVEPESTMDNTKARERKVVPSFVTKVDQEQGIVEHTVAVMGNVDLGGDRILPGAFTKTITERAGKIRVLDSHNSGSVLDIIGKPLSLWEVGRDSLPAEVRTKYPDATGALMARTQFLMDTPEGKGAFTRIRDGAVDEYSIGYDPFDVTYTDEMHDGKNVSVRNLGTIRLWEYSPVAFAMNPATSTLSAKEDAPQADADPPRYVGDEGESATPAEDVQGKADEPGTEEKELGPDGRPRRKLGDFLTGSIHRVFSIIADDLIINGFLSQEQRRLMSGAIGDALDVLNARIPPEIMDIDLDGSDGYPMFWMGITPLSEHKAAAEPAPGPDAQAATEPAPEQAGPPDQAPTREELLAEIDQYQKQIQRELTEET